MATTRYTHPAVRKAASVLRRLSDDEETRLQAQARELALINRVSELSAARQEGLEQALRRSIPLKVGRIAVPDPARLPN